MNRRGELDWLVSVGTKSGLSGADLFHSGRFAWAAPRGASGLIDGSTGDIAAKLAGILRAARCEVEPDAVPIAELEIKLPRSVRRAVHDLMSGARISAATLRHVSRRFQQSADRAGLIASGDIRVALHETLPPGQVHLEALRTSERGLDLLRFWVGAESSLWESRG